MILNSLHQLRTFKKNQSLSPDELRSIQEEKLRKVVRHAYEKVDYYRTLFDREGIKPKDIEGLDDICKIPVTTKKDLKKLLPHQITARGTDLNRCVVKHTSGSTGHPLKIFLSPEERDYQILLNLHILMENGLGLRDRVAYIINPHRFPKSRYWFQRLGILRREYLSVFDYPQKHAESLKRLKPDIIYGYPSNLTLLALYIKENRIKGIHPKAVFSVAEALEPKARALIDSVMGVRTCDILGTIEVGDLAWECEQHNGYHISADSVIVEFLKDGKPAQAGEEGRIVCTSLYGYTMPLIRYAVDDLCIPSSMQCECGRQLPIMESIQGRANDFILLPDGQVVASCFLVIIMQAFHGVAQYRVIQESKEELTVQIVIGNGNNSTQIKEKIKAEIEKAVERKLKVKIELLKELSRDRSGKIRTVSSTVIPEFQKSLDVHDEKMNLKLNG